MIDVSTLHPRRHPAPDGWRDDVYQRVVDAIAQALVNAYRRDPEREEQSA